MDLFNPFSKADSPVRSISSFGHHHENVEDDYDNDTSDTAPSFQFATSINDFINPGGDIETTSFVGYDAPAAPSDSTSAYSAHSSQPSSVSYSSSSNAYHLQLPGGKNINMASFFLTNAGRGKSIVCSFICLVLNFLKDSHLRLRVLRIMAASFFCS